MRNVPSPACGGGKLKAADRPPTPQPVLDNALMAARRTQIYLSAEQRKRLDERRRRERRTLADLVREAVDSYLADRHIDSATALNATFGALPKLEVPSRDEWERA